MIRSLHWGQSVIPAVDQQRAAEVDVGNVIRPSVCYHAFCRHAQRDNEVQRYTCFIVNFANAIWRENQLCVPQKLQRGDSLVV